jgi:hypothetical protein
MYDNLRLFSFFLSFTDANSLPKPPRKFRVVFGTQYYIPISSILPTKAQRIQTCPRAPQLRGQRDWLQLEASRNFRVEDLKEVPQFVHLSVFNIQLQYREIISTSISSLYFFDPGPEMLSF